jgi:acyl dehydratase
MFSAGLLATAITNWVGVGNLRHYRIRFVKQAWPGEEFSSRIRVTGKRVDGDLRLVELECSLSNQGGEVKVAGEAVAALPE